MAAKWWVSETWSKTLSDAWKKGDEGLMNFFPDLGGLTSSRKNWSPFCKKIWRKFFHVFSCLTRGYDHLRFYKIKGFWHSKSEQKCSNGYMIFICYWLHLFLKRCRCVDHFSFNRSFHYQNLETSQFPAFRSVVLIVLVTRNLAILRGQLKIIEKLLISRLWFWD